MIKKSKIPTILGIIILLGGLFAGVLLTKNNQIFKIGASATITPKDVRISNISDSSATITWITEDETSSFISYGTSTKLGMVAKESENDQKYFTHSITITGLASETGYYFKIISNSTTFDNNAVPWQFTTGKVLSSNLTSNTVSGSVISASGQPSKRAIVYITVGGYLVSTLTSESGTFVLQLGSVRTPDLSSYADIDPATTLLEVSAIAESGEAATARIFPQSANPIPALIIGQDQDFRGIEPANDGQNPDADLSVPEVATKESKFDVSVSETTKKESVTLESIEEGEVVSSDMPEFFGDGPTGKQITITVHSDTEVSGTAKVLSNGSWSWSPPTNLSEGTHTVTISWIDASGITKTITRSFVVQASELPAFVATPSATPKTTSTPMPTKSPFPTTKPTILPTPIPTSLLTSTSEALPESGSLTPTIILSIMGLAVLMFSFGLWKASENQ